MAKLVISFFTKNGVPETGLSPTIDIWEVSSASQTLVVNAGNMNSVGDGLYKYNFTTYDEKKSYVFKSDGTATLPDGERYQIATNDTFAEEIADFVWDETAADHNGLGTMGELQNDQTDLVAFLEELLKYDKNRTRIDKNLKTLTVYDDNGTTPLRVFDLRDDAGVLSITEIFERDPQ